MNLNPIKAKPLLLQIFLRFNRGLGGTTICGHKNPTFPGRDLSRRSDFFSSLRLESS